MIITDEYIEKLFEGTNFGEVINNCVKSKREYLKKSLAHQVEGLWTGRTMYQIMVYSGFLIDAKSHDKKKLTLLGEEFMSEQLPVKRYFDMAEGKDHTVETTIKDGKIVDVREK